ncbi:hypothetical protein QBC45DRAFT_62119 [Copromyces sp. CBS 386.78]|nr:hypothetical protein QBC45DRAFT_62119 [Copromyces sp. CBS 386.78]
MLSLSIMKNVGLVLLLAIGKEEAESKEGCVAEWPSGIIVRSAQTKRDWSLSIFRGNKQTTSRRAGRWTVGRYRYGSCWNGGGGGTVDGKHGRQINRRKVGRSGRVEDVVPALSLDFLFPFLFVCLVFGCAVYCGACMVISRYLPMSYSPVSFRFSSQGLSSAQLGNGLDMGIRMLSSWSRLMLLRKGRSRSIQSINCQRWAGR